MSWIDTVSTFLNYCDNDETDSIDHIGEELQTELQFFMIIFFSEIILTVASFTLIINLSPLWRSSPGWFAIETTTSGGLTFHTLKLA